MYVHVNIIRVLLRAYVLNKKLSLRLSLEEVLYTYSFKRLMANAQPLHLVTNFPNTNKNKPQGNVMVFGTWGCARDPMLRKFPFPCSLSADR